MTLNKALYTDLYSLTMLAGSLQDGSAHRKVTFSLFTRSLPEGRGYGVVAGVNRALRDITNLQFNRAHLNHLKEDPTLQKLPNLEQLLEFLEGYRFSGVIEGLADGDIFFKNTPILYVHGTFAECIILETLLLSILNHDSAIASAASRMRVASGGIEEPKLVDMGTRRTHEEAAIHSARASYIAGFNGTSNTEAAHQYGCIPLIGTAAHAFTLLHDNELEAFYAQAASLGEDTIYLVDTYDIHEGIVNAVTASNGNLKGIRIDSGDFKVNIPEARALLDKLGAPQASIVVSGDMDEYSLTELNHLPIAMFGVGTRLVTGSGHPTCGMVYKLVERENSEGVKEAVSKNSFGKATIPGYLNLMRNYDNDGNLLEEAFVNSTLRKKYGKDGFRQAHQVLLSTLVKPLVEEDAIQLARQRHQGNIAALPQALKSLVASDEMKQTITEGESYE